MGSTPDLAKDGPTYLAQYKRGMGGYKPYAWAWHAYTDGKRRPKTQNVNQNGWTILRRLLRATKATHRPVWLTEQGAVYRINDATTAIAVNGPVDDMIVRCYAHEVWKVSSRIQRFSYYQFRGESGWDSGLRGTTGTVRNVFDQYRLRASTSNSRQCATL